uniref:Thiamine pyrophosphate-binding protein n=1 Tax=Caldiarchaeum subterraneum TaxID=311458 RepID=A0A7C5QKP1_CALS0
MVKMSGGEILVECLLRERVEYVFGVPGDRFVPFLDAIYRTGVRRGLRFIMTRHEQAAAHMADAYYRVAGRPAVCVGTAGPGAADLVPGVYPAYADNIPMVIITAQNQSWRSYPDHGSMQALDQHTLFKAVTKWSAVVNNINRIPELVQRAFRTALSGRMGPVHLDIPSDIFYGETEVSDTTTFFQKPAMYRCTSPPQANPDLVRLAAEMLANASLPLIHVGSGVLRSGASDEVRMLAEMLEAPVVTSLASRGVVSEDSVYCLIPGSPGALAVQSAADVVLHVGGKLGDTDFWGRSPPWGEVGVQRWIQVDIDPEMIGFNRPVDVALVGDAKAVLRQLLSELKNMPLRKGRNLSELRKLVDDWIKSFFETALQTSYPIHPLRAILEVRSFFPHDAISVVDGGNTAVWAHYLNRVYEPDTFIWAADSGHLGSGLPYAIAAKLAKPEKHVYLLSGDGAFMLNIQELETAARLGTQIVAVVLNDMQWGMIKGAQKLMAGGRYIGVDFSDARYDLVAEAMGCFGRRVSRAEEIRPALEEALASRKPAVIDVTIDREANLTPPDLQTLAAIWLEGCVPPERVYDEATVMERS